MKLSFLYDKIKDVRGLISDISAGGEVMEQLILILRQKNIYFNERYFLYVMGSIFLLGIVGGSITRSIYRGLTREAMKINNSNVKVMKQIKMKYEQFILINGSMMNTYRMVERYIRNYKVGKIRIAAWKNIVNASELMLLIVSGMMAGVVYIANHNIQKTILISLIGSFLALSLFMYERVIKVEEAEEDLVCHITDYLDNTLNTKAKRVVRTECTVRDMERRMEEERAIERENKKIKENIITDILDSYL